MEVLQLDHQLTVYFLEGGREGGREGGDSERGGKMVGEGEGGRERRRRGDGGREEGGGGEEEGGREVKEIAKYKVYVHLYMGILDMPL